MEDRPRPRGFGPALVVAAVVLGPGSILTSSRVGADFGFGLVWVVILATCAMVAQVALAARAGAVLGGSPCDEIARRVGRPLAALVGLVVFGIVACFQFGNNVAIAAGLRPLLGLGETGVTVALVAWNVALISVIAGTRRLYRPLELFLRGLILAMVVAFACNLVLARPAPGAFLRGVVPSLPGAGEGAVLSLLGLVGTTFSVAAAFYQAYLVREKGWGPGEARRGFHDSVLGITVLGCLTLLVMATAATALHGKVAGSELGSVADVARVLEPLLGARAQDLFCLGLLAGALSSCLVNVMIGGTVLSDGLGLGARMDERWPRRLTILALVLGTFVALFVLRTGRPPVGLIVFAQALTVLGNPLLAAALLWLGTRRGPDGERVASLPLLVAGGAGAALALAFAVRTTMRLL